MFLESEEKESGTSPSLTGSYPCVNRGARRLGAHVFFEVFANSAESVLLVGSFNGWKETHPMKRDADGVWRICLSASEISDGDRYKFKIFEDGREVYITDPYAVELDGYPNYNAVYRDIENALANCDGEERVGCSDLPLNIYELRACRHNDGRSMSYADIAQEFPPYLMQMGYTHILFGDLCEEFYDHAHSRHDASYLAPRIQEGGIKGFRELVQAMHRLGIGVIIDLGMRGIPEYAKKDRFFIDCCLYWADVFGVDGFTVDDSGMFSYMGAVRAERAHICFISKNKDLGGENFDAVAVDCDSCPLSLESLACDASAFNRKMILRAYNTFASGKIITHMGCENTLLSDSAESSRLQLFTSDLNAIYLSCESLWRDGRSIKIISDDLGICGVECCCDGERTVLLFDPSGEGRELRLPKRAEYKILLDSLSQRYGGSRRGDMSICDGRILLDRFEVVVLEEMKN